MPLTPEQRDAVTSELKRFGIDLNLSEDQKQKLQGFMTDASEKLQEYKQQNPNASKEDLIKKVTENRAAIRQRLASFMTPEQLAKIWIPSWRKPRNSWGRSSLPNRELTNRFFLYRRVASSAGLFQRDQLTLSVVDRLTQ